MSLVLGDSEERQDKTRRARAAVAFYTKNIVPPRPRPDGEPDRKLNAILDRLAADLVDLAGYLSESARWLEFASKPMPPAWAIPFLSEEELAALGLSDQKSPLPSPPASDDPFAAALQYAIDHYDQLPDLDPETNRPWGEIL